MQKFTTYECPRCAFTARNLWAYKRHLERQIVCSSVDVEKNAIVPGLGNVIRKCVVRHNGVDVTINGDTMHADAATTVINNTNTVNAENAVINNFNWSGAAPRSPKMNPMRFPFQNYDHLTTNQKRTIINSAGDGTHEGFVTTSTRLLALRPAAAAQHERPIHEPNGRVHFRPKPRQEMDGGRRREGDQ